MSSIPLPALDLRAPQQQNPLEQYAQLVQLRNAMQNAPLQHQQLQQEVQAGQLENQQRQQQAKDQQAMTSAMQQWDGKSFDELAPLVMKSGGSAQAVMGLKQKALEQRKQASEIAKSDAETGSSNVATLLKKNDLVSGALSTVMQAPDDQIPQALMATTQQLSQQGLLDPQHTQMAQQIAQSGDPNKIRQSLDVFRKGMMSYSQLLDEEQKKAQTEETKATTQKTKAEMEFGGNQAMADSKYRFIQQKAAAGQKLQPDEQTFVRAYEKQKLLVPQATAQVRIEGMQQSREYPVFDNQTHTTLMLNAADINAANRAQPGRYSAPGYTPEALGQKGSTEYFTKGKGGQQLTAFNTAMQHLDTLDKLSGDLHNSNVQIVNKAANAIAQQFGDPSITNFSAAKNAMAGEVAAALKTSGATDEEIKKVDSTFSSAQTPAQLKGAISTYRSLLGSKAHNLKQQYESGMQGKPNFQPETSADPFAQFGGKAH